MSEVKFITREEVLALREQGLESFRLQEPKAIADWNTRISKAAKQGRSDVEVVGKTLNTYATGPIMHNEQLLLTPDMVVALTNAGFVVSYPHIHGKEVTVVVSW